VPASTKKRLTKEKDIVIPTSRRSTGTSATASIRKISEEWAHHWNEGNADGVAGLYAVDADYLPPHHEAVHGRDAIREYLKIPLAHGVSDLSFAVSDIRQQGTTAWDVGTYHMLVPQSDGTKKEDRGKYLSVWRLTGKNWLLVADAWSSDLPPSM
jgi:uncharacterized protein (TIGR02246 family)